MQNRPAPISIVRRRADISGHENHRRQGQAAHGTIHHLTFHSPHLQVNTVCDVCQLRRIQGDKALQGSHKTAENGAFMKEIMLFLSPINIMEPYRKTADGRFR